MRRPFKPSTFIDKKKCSVKSSYNLAFLFFLLLTAIVNVSKAQRTIRGQVVDAETGLPVEYVCIGIPMVTVPTFSDLDGRFELLIDGSRSTDTLIFHRVGYQPRQVIVKSIETSDSVIVLL